MKSEKGITLTTLIIYIIILLIVVSILSTVSKYFYRNTKYLDNVGKYSAEFNKFNMYFIEDVKNNVDTYNVEDNKIVFQDGNTYTFLNDKIYRNKIEICKNVYTCKFSKSEDTNEDGFTKKIINVLIAIKGSKLFEAENEYVLKYW